MKRLAGLLSLALVVALPLAGTAHGQDQAPPAPAPAAQRPRPQIEIPRVTQPPNLDDYVSLASSRPVPQSGTGLNPDRSRRRDRFPRWRSYPVATPRPRASTRRAGSASTGSFSGTLAISCRSASQPRRSSPTTRPTSMSSSSAGRRSPRSCARGWRAGNPCSRTISSPSSSTPSTITSVATSSSRIRSGSRRTGSRPRGRTTT